MIRSKRAQREAKQLFRLCLADGMADGARVRSVARRILQSGRRDSVAVFGQFLRLARLDEAQHAAIIESATPLPAELQTGLRESLIRRYGRGLTVTFAERPALLGGVRIQVGSDVYDGSVLARLAALEKSF